ncbi:MAG: hypothetical protein GY896_22755 [Gammaproteobacteria bacterium]|nr:hypothetical protein [Gammaproteobacteria bacterium]
MACDWMLCDNPVVAGELYCIVHLPDILRTRWVEPNERERERLYILIEELNEAGQIFSRAQHIAMKVLRFGFDEVYPKTETDNRARLEEELGDVAAMIEIMVLAGDVSATNIVLARKAKFEKLKRFMRNKP